VYWETRRWAELYVTWDSSLPLRVLIYSLVNLTFSSVSFPDIHRFVCNSSSTYNGTSLQTTTFNYNPQHTTHHYIISLFPVVSIPSFNTTRSFTIRRTSPAERTGITASSIRTADNMGCGRFGITSACWRWGRRLGRGENYRKVVNWFVLLSE
jgi:hypothetical protein